MYASWRSHLVVDRIRCQYILQWWLSVPMFHIPIGSAVDGFMLQRLQLHFQVGLSLRADKARSRLDQPRDSYTQLRLRSSPT